MTQSIGEACTNEIMIFSNIVDDYVISLNNNTNPDHKFYGKWVYKYILDETINPHIVYLSDEYLKSHLWCDPRFEYDMDDYYFHKAMICISFENYARATYWYEKLSGSGQLLIELEKWNTTKAMLSKAVENFSTNTFSAGYITTRDYTSIVSKIPSDFHSVFAILLVRLQNSVFYWDSLDHDNSYIECLISLNQACTLFESILKHKALLINPSCNTQSIDTLITNAIQSIDSKIGIGYRSGNGISPARTAPDFVSNYSAFISTLSGITNHYEFIGLLMCLCRVTRNNCLHGIDLHNKLFIDKNDYRLKVDVIIEGILQISVHDKKLF